MACEQEGFSCHTFITVIQGNQEGLEKNWAYAHATLQSHMQKRQNSHSHDLQGQQTHGLVGVLCPWHPQELAWESMQSH